MVIQEARDESAGNEEAVSQPPRLGGSALRRNASHRLSGWNSRYLGPGTYVLTSEVIYDQDGTALSQHIGQGPLHKDAYAQAGQRQKLQVDSGPGKPREKPLKRKPAVSKTA